MKTIMQTTQVGRSRVVPVSKGRVEPSIRTDAVYVVFTSHEETVRALHMAAAFAQPLGAPVTLVHFRTVPYAVPVDVPAGISPVESKEFVDRLADEELDIQFRIYLCRDESMAVRSAFEGRSLIVLGMRHGWWHRSSRRLRRLLEAAGHLVVTVGGSQPHGEVERAQPVLHEENVNA